MDATVPVGLVLVGAAWSWLFTAGKRRFWPHAAVAGVLIGLYAALAQRDRLGELLTPTVADVALGVAVAVALYGLFWAGDVILTRLVPSFRAHVGDVYAMQGGSHLATMVLTLVVVGTCEELFWRGLVQDRAGFALALAGYVAVLVWDRNWALLLAAAVGGAWWGGLFAWRGTLVAPIVSHALWDLAVVVWRPLQPGRPPTGPPTGW